MSYYANGYFKAKSTKLLKKQQLETLSGKTDEKFFELLRNYGFGFNDSIEELYTKEINNLKNDLIHALGSLKELKVFFYPFDILNTKLIYKQIKEDIETSSFYVNCGNINPYNIHQALKYGDFADINEYEELFTNIKNIKDENYLNINYQTDCLFIEQMIETSKTSKPIKDYLQVKLDITNFLSVIRAQKLSLGKEFLQNTVFTTLTMDKKDVISLYDMSIDEIEKKAINLSYFSVARSVVNYKKDHDLENLESNFEKNLYEILIDYSFQSDGLGYIMSYIYQKLMELKNIKIIYYNRTTSLDKLVILE